MDGLVRGEFEYRALQGNAVINHCDAVVPWTRMIEHKHFNPQADDPDCSVLTKETPMAWSRDETPYYSFNNDAKGMAPLTHDIRDFWYSAGENLPRYRVLLDF